MAERQPGDEAAWEGELFRLLVENVRDYAIFVIDPEGLVRTWSHGAEALLGYQEDEILGRPVDRIFTPEDVRDDAPRSEMREALATGRGVDDRWHVRKDGTRFWASGVMTCLKDEGGRLRGFAKIMRDRTEWWEVEQARRGSEARTAAVLETALDAILTIDHEGKVVEFNPAAERMFGYDRAEVVGRDMAGLIIPPRLRDAHHRGLAHYLATGEGPVLDRRIEIEAVRADGTEFPVELAITRVPAVGPPHFTAYLRDITVRREQERRRAAQLALTQVLAEASTVADAAPRILRAVCEGLGWETGAFWLVDRPGEVLRCLDVWNRPDSRTGGFEASSRGRTFARGVGLPGRVWAAAEPAWLADVDGDDNFPRRAVASEEGLHGALAFPILGGSEVLGVVEFFSRSARESDADLLVMVGNFAAQVGQFVERKRAEEALRDSEGRFRTMAESIPQLAWMARPDGHIYWYNRRWHEYTGTTPEEMEGWGWQKVHDPDVLPAVLERWQGSIASGEPFDMVFPLRDAEGHFRPFLTRVAPVKGEDGDIAHWFGTNTDIADRLRIEEELRAAKEEAEAASRAKTQFLAVLSHELRTPLNPILLAASSMLERPCEPEEIRPTLEMIRQNVNLQARLIDDLLDVMRIVRGKMPLHWEVADCHKLIDRAIQICRSEVFGGELRLKLDLAATHRHLNADAARLQQMFWNLIKNAVKFTPEGGTITIRTYNEAGTGGPGDRIVIEVADTGIGIEPEVLPTIWDPFQQGETTITRRFGGLGLGLAICKGVVDAHGGTIAAESGGKGLGTTFRVVLKALPEQVVVGDGEPVAGVLHAESGLPPSLRILVVEDEPATLRLMARLLRGLGHAVTTAGTIASGYEAFEAGEFDLIVSDIGLPDGTGLELMRRVVALRGHVPAIALTGYGMEDDINRSREAGFTAHMTKPIDFTKLESMIRRVVTGDRERGPALTRDEGGDE